MKPMRIVVSVLLLAMAGFVRAGPNLHGTWSGDDFVIVLNGDGSGTMSDSAWTPPEPLRWTANANTLTITQDGEAVEYEFRLQGDRLHVAGGDLDESIDLTRSGAKQGATDVAQPAANVNAASNLGSCDGACRHYLQCAGSVDMQAYLECAGECAAAGYEASFLAWFETSDCPTALAIVQALDAQQRGFEGAGQQSSPSSGGQCDGCVWDGNECAWYSQGNWGSNVAYSGAVISCDAGCCR